MNDREALDRIIAERRHGAKPIITPQDEMGATRLNFGCGDRTLPTFINADKYQRPGTDMVLDFEDPSWSHVPDDRFTFVLATDVLEHIPHRSPAVDGELFISLVNELLRISAPGALWEVCSPHWRNRSAHDSPGHCRVVNEHAFWPWLDVELHSNEMVSRVRGNGAGLRPVRAITTRQFQLGPASDYHARRYAGLNLGRPCKRIMVFRVVKDGRDIHD